MNKDLENQLIKSKEASRKLSTISEDRINLALTKIKDKLLKYKDDILNANKIDLEKAKVTYLNKNIPLTMLSRLELTEEKIEKIANSIDNVIKLNNNIGEVIETYNRPNGLVINKVRVPIGLMCAIFESRPNVSVDVSVLALKTNNAIILKGGSDAINTNTVIVDIIRKAIKDIVPIDSVCLIKDTNHEVVDELIKAKSYIDLVIPRGGKNLINYVTNNAMVPVIETGAGNCHLYVNKYASLKNAINILINAKTQNPSVCNAIESMLVDEEVADVFLPLAKTALDKYKVIIKGDEKVSKIIDCEMMTEEDKYKEYNDYIISISIVKDFFEAVEHINKYSTHHSDAIVTENKEIAEYFLNNVDSACVYVNASTRFSDGGEFGFGAELGISTQKLHARGPMGLKEMTTYKYKIYGDGQVRK